MISSADGAYKQLLTDLLEEGEVITTRNSRVRRILSRSFKFNRFPLVTKRKTSWKTALREWEWFMSGSNKLDDLHPTVHPWWKDWADDDNRVANNYSVQFRDFRGHKGNAVDQIQYLLDGIKNHPFSRRTIITTWNTADMVAKETPITNCHTTLLMPFVDTKNRLHFDTTQRSVDTVCGLPANWAQSWAFLVWTAHRTGREVGTLTWKGGDIHLYDIHEELARKIVATESGPAPDLVYTPTSDAFLANDFTLSGKYHYGFEERAVMVV